MLGEAFLEEEHLAADLALAALLAGVTPLVNLAGVRLAKGLSTVLAGEVLALLVHHLHVVGQSLFVVGGVVALPALVLLLLGVGQDVLVPLLPRRLAHSAVRAHVVLDARVPQEMIAQHTVDRETLSADLAGEGQLLAGVLVHVLLEGGGAAEHFLALRAGEVPLRGVHLVHPLHVEAEQHGPGEGLVAAFVGARMHGRCLRVGVLHMDPQSIGGGEACN